MGQAKQRGTYEQRKAEGEAKRAERRKELRKRTERLEAIRDEYYASLSPQARRNLLNALFLASAIAGVTNG